MRPPIWSWCSCRQTPLPSLVFFTNENSNQTLSVKNTDKGGGATNLVMVFLPADTVTTASKRHDYRGYNKPKETFQPINVLLQVHHCSMVTAVVIMIYYFIMQNMICLRVFQNFWIGAPAPVRRVGGKPCQQSGITRITYLLSGAVVKCFDRKFRHLRLEIRFYPE